jgi:DNA-directed RNA polymerase specialized sigma24 family protein
MKKTFDYEYLGGLLEIAQAGNRTAFAELYAATYIHSYEYAYRYLQDEMLAKEALRKIYATALREIQSLRTPELFVTWLNRISFQVCFEIQKKPGDADLKEEMIPIGSRRYSLNQVMRLPLTEAQVLIQHYYMKLPIRENAKNLDISRASVKRNLRIGRLHLKKLLGDF